MSDSTFRSVPDEEWEDLIRQLHDRPKVRPRPFFYGRLNARLTAVDAAESRALPGWVLRPAYAALFGAMVLTLSGDGRAERPAPGAARVNAHDSVQPLPRLPH